MYLAPRVPVGIPFLPAGPAPRHGSGVVGTTGLTHCDGRGKVQPMSRWDWLEGVRAQTPVEWAVGHMAGILLQELSSWPPEVDWVDSRARARYQKLFAPGAPPPSQPAIEHAIMRAGWDLAHDDEALEHYRRNHLLEQACPDPHDRLASELVQTYLTEALLELIERTENRIKRRDAIACLARLSDLLRHQHR